MLDFHSHILPGLDDGAPDMDSAIQMARIAVEDGITTMVATPHFIEASCENHKDVIMEKMRGFQQILVDNSIFLKVIAGAEVYLTPDVPDRLSKGQLMTINNGGRYLLVEFPMTSLPMYVEEILFEIQIQGITPIIAHPERNLMLTAKPERILNLVAGGCLLQINAGSITGLYGSRIKNTAELFVKNGFIHLIGSDAHSAGGRSPRMKKAFSQIERINPEKGKEIAINGKKVLAGDEIILSPIAKVEGFKGIWHNIRSLFG